MSETTPQTTTGDPVGNGTGQRRGPSGDNGRRNDFRKKQDHFQGKRDDEEIPTALRHYRYAVNNNNPSETFDRVTHEIAQYVATEIQGAGYIRRFIIDLEEPKVTSPPKPIVLQEEADSDEDYETELEIWKEEIKLVARRRTELKCNILPSVYAVIWRQCTTEMKELLKSSDTFSAIDEANDVIALLRLIRTSTVIDRRSQHPTLTVLQALNNFTSFRQMNLSNDVYLEGFRDRANILEDITGDMLGCDRKSIEKEFGGPITGVSINDPSLIAAKKRCREKFLAIAFIQHSDKKRYGDLQSQLSNDYLRKKTDEYPADLVHASDILNKWKGSSGSQERNSSFTPMFIQQEDNGGRVNGGRGGGRRGVGSGSKPINATNDSINPYLCTSNRATKNVDYAIKVDKKHW
jgi:hypothetical protein